MSIDCKNSESDPLDIRGAPVTNIGSTATRAFTGFFFADQLGIHVAGAPTWTSWWPRLARGAG